LLFSFAFLAYAPPRAAGQNTGSTGTIVVPAPPFIGNHYATQDKNDPETAHDKWTGQDLKWDRDKKSWVDIKTGQALGFDGQLASDGSVIPAPPFIDTPGMGLHEAAQQKVTQNNGHGNPGLAFDDATHQILHWDPAKQSWFDTTWDPNTRSRIETGPALGFSGLALNAGAPAALSTTAATPPPTAIPTSETGGAGPCPDAEECVVLKQIYDEADARVIAASQALTQATADRESDLTQAAQLDRTPSRRGDPDVSKAEHEQAQGLRDKLPNAQANYDAAAKACLAAWENYQNCLKGLLKDCPPKSTAQTGHGTGAAAMGAGALSGFAFVGADNTVSLGRSPAPPAGAQGAADATVSVGSSSSKTDGAGAFTITNIPAGLGTLHVATGTGTAGDFPVTVFGGATAQLGAPAVTRADAQAAVMKALATITRDPKATIIIGPQEPLPAGTTIAPAYGDDNGEPSEALNYTARTEQWFVYVDPDATARYQHPVEFFFVDAATGTVTKLDETSWPLINGLGYYGSRDADTKSPDLMVGPPVLSGPKSTAIRPAPRAQAAAIRDAGDSASAHTLETADRNIRAHMMLASMPAAPARTSTLNFVGRADLSQVQNTATSNGGGTTYALIIEGADESDENADIQNIPGLFGHGGIPVASVQFSKPSDSVGLNGPGRSPRMDEVMADFKKDCGAAQPNDTLFIYITGHGLKNGGVQLDSNGVDKFGIPVTFETLMANSFNFSGCKACHIIIIIDACYSGKMASQFNDILKKKGCVNYTIISATDSTHESRGIPSWYPGVATGGYFTNKLISAFSDQAAANPTGTVDLTQAFQTAKAATNSSWLSHVPEQNPQIYVQSAPPGCCGSSDTMTTGTGSTTQTTNQTSTVPSTNTEAGTQTQPTGSSPSNGVNTAPGAPAQPESTNKSSLASDLCERAKALRDIAAHDRQMADAAQDQRTKDYLLSDAKMMDGMAKEREDLARYYDPNACPEHAQAIPGGNGTSGQNGSGSQSAGGTSTTPGLVGNGPWIVIFPGMPLWNTEEQRWYGQNPDHSPREETSQEGSGTWIMIFPGLPLWNVDEQRWYGYNPDHSVRTDEPPIEGPINTSPNSSAAPTPTGETPTTAALQCTSSTPTVRSQQEVDVPLSCTGTPPQNSSIRLRSNAPISMGDVQIKFTDSGPTMMISGTLGNNDHVTSFNLPQGPGNVSAFKMDVGLKYKITADYDHLNLGFRGSSGIDITPRNWTAPIKNDEIGSFNSFTPQWGGGYQGWGGSNSSSLGTPVVGTSTFGWGLNRTPSLCTDTTTTTEVSPYDVPLGSSSFGSGFGYSPPPCNLNLDRGTLTLGGGNDFGFGGLRGWSGFNTPGGYSTGTSGWGPGSGQTGGYGNDGGWGQIPQTPAGTTGLTSNGYGGFYNPSPSPFGFIRPQSYYDDGPQYFGIFDPWNRMPSYCDYDFPDKLLRASPELAQALAAEARSRQPRASRASREPMGAHLQLVSLRRVSPTPNSSSRAGRAQIGNRGPAQVNIEARMVEVAQTFSYSIVSNGKSTGQAFELQVADPTGKVKTVAMRDGTVLEAIKPGVTQPVAAPAGGNVVKQPLNGYCLEFHKQPPAAETLYRIADPAAQQKYASLRFLDRAAAQMSQNNQFHPDSDPSAYKDSIFQYALWSKLEGWGAQEFTQHFIERIKENAQATGAQWTQQMEDTVLGAAPGRWRDISEMMNQAQALEKASQERASSRQTREQR
jgi:hypothetical protein